MIGVQTPMNEAAKNTLTQTLSDFLEPILEASNIALDSVTVVGNPQHSGVMLDVSVKFTGLYRPTVEQNLGRIIIAAFSSGTQNAYSSSVIMQNAFISSLSSQGSYFNGVVSVLLTLKENGSRPAPPPTPPPVAAPTMFYLSVTLYNTPYQTRYMEDSDFDKFAEVLISVVNTHMEDSMTTIKRVVVGQYKLISIGNFGLTATEVDLGYEVSTNLSASKVGYEVATAVGQNRQEILSLLEDEFIFYPYFLEVDEIQAQNVATIGDPSSSAALPNVIPEKPAQEGSGGPLVGELLASDEAKAQAEKEKAKALADMLKAQAEADAANRAPVVNNTSGGLGTGGE